MTAYLYLAIAIVIALLSTRLMKKIKLPNVTGFLLTGIIVGPCVLGLFFNNFDFLNSFKSGNTIYDFVDKLGFISVIALGFIAFTIGNNFKLSSIKKIGKRIVVVTILESFGAAIFVFLGLMCARFIEIGVNNGVEGTITWPLILTLSAISCATAPAATLLVIKQYKADGPLVRTLLPVVALDDAAALILFSILFGIAKVISKNESVNVAIMISTPLIEIILSLLIGGILGFVISLLCKVFKSRANRFGLCLFGILANIGIYELFKTIDFPLFHTFELSSLLMCMSTSAVFVNMFKDSDNVMERMDLVTPPIFMLFFVLSGANLNLTIFASNDVIILLIIALTYLIFRVIGKYIGAFLGTKCTNCEPNVSKYLGFTLIPQAGVAIGLATSAGKALGSDSKMGSIIVASILISTIIYELFGPVITKVSLLKAGEIKES